VSSGLVGRPLPRREDARILAGESRYLDDIDPPGALHVAFVRSPHAHARIEAIRKPSEAPGLAAVLTADDIAGHARDLPIQKPPNAEVADAPHPLLARGEVRYAGQPVVAVIADSRALAEDAAELVEVDYEPLDPVVDPLASPEELASWHKAGGDVDGAFAAADHVVRGTYAMPRLVASPMETRGAIAEHDPDADLLTFWCSAQDTHRQLANLAHVLDRPRESLRVVVPDVGGAFGSKGVLAPEAGVVAVAALQLGRPVKWTEDRLENFVAAYQGRGMHADVELALTADGRMLAIRARLVADIGGYLIPNTAIPPHTAAMLMCGVYRLEAADVTLSERRTNKVPTGPYRGAGRPEAAYFVERIVDDAARELGIDPVELRRRNLIREFPHATPLGWTYDSGDYERCLDRALELVRPERSEDERRIVATGVGMYVERSGGMFESAEAIVASDGAVTIRSSASPHGQGHATTFAQIAAERLGVDVSSVTMEFGDSALVPPGTGTFASRSTAMAGSAIVRAVEALQEQAGDGGLGGRELRASARFESDLVFAAGAYAAVVEVERTTGRLRVLRIAAVDDAGTIVNPLLAEGQVIGGTAQGLGECLTEEALFDEIGQPTGASYLDYSLLTAAEMPPIATDFVESPSPLNPLGAKGIGEGGAIGTPAAVGNAVAAAVGRNVDPPYTEEKLWRALQRPQGVAAPQVDLAASAQPIAERALLVTAVLAAGAAAVWLARRRR
jgi:aerobic carbon-monoxide dehydrogenase large subunit